MKKHTLWNRGLSLLLAAILVFGLCPRGLRASAADTPDYGTTTFVYVGSNASVTGANLEFYVTWGTSTYNDSAANCGISVSASGNTVTLTVDKSTLTDTTVWMNAWENLGWTTWNGISTTFSGETYYLSDTGVSTTPPATEEDPTESTEEPTEEPTEPEADWGTTTYVYVGSDESLTAANFTVYITWGTATYNANAKDCGIEVTRSGNTITLKADKNALTDTTVWLKIWEDKSWTTWEGLSTTFSGETFYIYDDKVSTEAPAEEEEPTEEPTEPSEEPTEPTEEPTEPVDPDADWGTTTYIYAGSDESLTAANFTVYITWGTATYNANAEDCGIEVTRDGNTITLKADKNALTDATVWLKIWEDKSWTTWEGLSTTFSGETFYIYDDKVSTEAPGEGGDPTEPVEKITYQFTVHCYGEGYQAGAWMALVEDGVEIAWTPSSPAKTAVFGNPEDGWTSATITWELTETYNRLGLQIGQELWTGNKYNYDFTGTSGEIWIVPDDPRVYTSKEAALEGMESEYEAPYSFTIHCKGEGYQIGAWMELMENGSSVAWTSEAEGVTAVLGETVDGWSSVTISWDSLEEYNRLGFVLGTTDPWVGTRYTYDFKSPTGEEIWVVPGYSGAYSTKEAAQANAWSYYYQFTIHCYGEGYQAGAWMAKVVEGEEVEWTPSASSQIRSFGNLQDGWTTATVAWSSKTLYNRLGFQIGVDSPWEGTKYSYDFTERVGEIWILPDDPTVYLSEEEALEALNNPASAKYSFHIHCYGESYQIGAWLALVQGGEEVAWTPDAAAVTAAFASEGDGWSDAWIKWSPAEDYNRLGFTIGVDDPWASDSYSFDFEECPVDLWIIPGDMTVYLSREEAEEAMTPGEEMTIPPETEPVETEPVQEPEQEEASSPLPIIGLCGGAAGIGFIWWLILFLRKRKKK